MKLARLAKREFVRMNQSFSGMFYLYFVVSIVTNRDVSDPLHSCYWYAQFRELDYASSARRYRDQGLDVNKQVIRLVTKHLKKNDVHEH